MWYDIQMNRTFGGAMISLRWFKLKKLWFSRRDNYQLLTGSQPTTLDLWCWYSTAWWSPLLYIGCQWNQQGCTQYFSLTLTIIWHWYYRGCPNLGGNTKMKPFAWNIHATEVKFYWIITNMGIQFKQEITSEMTYTHSIT